MDFQQRHWRDWYSAQVWRNRAKAHLRQQPICELCKQRFATVADHIESHEGDLNKFLLGALQSLCAQCHNQRKRLVEERGYDTRIGADGYPLDQQHPFYQQQSK